MYYTYNSTLVAANTFSNACAFLKCKGISIKGVAAKLMFDVLHDPSGKWSQSILESIKKTSSSPIFELSDGESLRDQAAILRITQRQRINQVKVHAHIPLTEVEAFRKDCESSQLWKCFLEPIRTICISLFPLIYKQEITFKVHTADNKILRFIVKS